MKRHRNVYDDLLVIFHEVLSLPNWKKPKNADLQRVLRKIIALGEEPGTVWNITRERMTERVTRYSAIGVELTKKTPLLLEGPTPAERLASFHRLAAHVEAIWRESVLLYQAGGFPRACFLAVTCLEEIGKTVSARMTVMFESVGGEFTSKPVETSKRRENPFYDHSEKHFLAAGSGALLNPRLDEIMGPDEVEQVLATMESGELAKIRERCLYVDVTDQGLIWPAENITAETARKWIVVAGEIMLEVLGFPDSEWERMRPLVEEFESSG